MAEWWTYSLSDFLLFSPRVYYRLIELHNRDWWPAHLAAALLGLGLAVTVRAEGARLQARLLALLGGAWLWIAWAFFWERYATINWAAPYVAPAFALQGLILIVAALLAARATPPPATPARRTVGGLLLAFGLAGYPLLAPALGRPWRAAETFAVLPDPTVVATLGVLTLANLPLRRLALVVPVLWCLVTGATLWTMGAADAFAAPAAALAALVATWTSGRGRRHTPPRP
ncbi:MAG: DUF6064 family protein [Hyphomicrobiaceae bacterium]